MSSARTITRTTSRLALVFVSGAATALPFVACSTTEVANGSSEAGAPSASDPARSDDAASPRDHDAGDGATAPKDGGALVPVTGEAGTFIPPILAPDYDLTNCKLPNGTPFAYGTVVDVDDCIQCECSWRGGRCRRSPSCARDVCVFVDGTTMAAGTGGKIAPCFDCTCGSGGVAACTRDATGDCPANGCRLPKQSGLAGGVVAIGDSAGMSECHTCDCHATKGLSCRDQCHGDGCYCPGDFCPTRCGKGGCAELDGGALRLADQERIPAGSCATLFCDYGSLHRDESTCP